MPKILFDWKLHATREKIMHAQKSRTAEVTICIIPERTARSPSTITVRLESQVVEIKSTVSLPRVSNVLLMVVHHNSHTESSRNQYHLPLRGNHIFRAENFGQWDSNLPNLARCHDDRGFSSSRSVRFLQTLQLIPPAMGNVPTVLNNKRGQGNKRKHKPES